MTTANKITVLRILLIPVFISQVLYYVGTGEDMFRWWAVAAFAFASVSDGIDGFIARKFNQRSELGAVLDPLADKLLLVSGLVLLCLDNEPHLERIPIWLASIVFGRDIILALGALVIYYFCGKVRVRPNYVGKCATVLQMAVVLWVLLRWDVAWLEIIMWGAGATTAISGLFYVWDGMQQLGQSPHSSPSNSAPENPDAPRNPDLPRDR